MILYGLTRNIWGTVFAPSLSLVGACLYETFCSYSTTMVETVYGSSSQKAASQISEMFDVTHIHQGIARRGHVNSTRLSRDHLYVLLVDARHRPSCRFALRFDGENGLDLCPSITLPAIQFYVSNPYQPNIDHRTFGLCFIFFMMMESVRG